VNLAKAAVGTVLTVERLALDPTTSRRLGELGVRPGQQVMLCRRTGLGGLVVGIGPLRLGLDRATARAIEVVQAGSGQSADGANGTGQSKPADGVA